MEKEKWIESIINSGKSLPQVTANPFMATRVEAKIHLRNNNTPANIPLRWVYASLAGMAVLLVLNVLVWSTNSHTQRGSGIQQVIQEYGWGNNNDLYSMNYSK